jgi:hypothetical protein
MRYLWDIRLMMKIELLHVSDCTQRQRRARAIRKIFTDIHCKYFACVYYHQRAENEWKAQAVLHSITFACLVVWVHVISKNKRARMVKNILWHMIITRNLEHTRHDPREKFNIVVFKVTIKKRNNENGSEKEKVRRRPFFGGCWCNEFFTLKKCAICNFQI